LTCLFVENSDELFDVYLFDFKLSLLGDLKFGTCNLDSELEEEFLFKSAIPFYVFLIFSVVLL